MCHAFELGMEPNTVYIQVSLNTLGIFKGQPALLQGLKIDFVNLSCRAVGHSFLYFFGDAFVLHFLIQNCVEPFLNSGAI